MALADDIDAALREVGDAERAVKERAYLKSSLTHYGASVPAIRAVAKRFAAGLDHDALVEVVEALWAEPVHERRMAAVELLDARSSELGPGDAPLIERLLRESRTWALVDGLAASVAGKVVEPNVLDRWVVDDDFWLRRSALLALLVPLRQGGGDFDRFGRYADSLLDDREWFVQKAIGWVLRDTARKRPDLVFDWVLPRWHRLPAVARREIVKPMTPEQVRRLNG